MADEEKTEHINLKVITQEGSEIYFKCKKTTPFLKLMHAFCNRQHVRMESVRFLFDGNRINETQTPSQVRDIMGAPRAQACARRVCDTDRLGCRSGQVSQAFDAPNSRRAHPPASSQLEMEDGDVIDVMVEQQGGLLS